MTRIQNEKIMSRNLSIIQASGVHHYKEKLQKFLSPLPVCVACSVVTPGGTTNSHVF